MDAERQWFKAKVGLPGVQETPRAHAFCAHAIGSQSLFEVQDATAGAPLTVGEGSAVGTLCVIDQSPRQMTEAQRRTLTMLAATEARFRALVEQQSEIVSLAKPCGEPVYVNEAYARHHGLSVASLVGTNLLDHVPPAERAAVRRQLDQVLNTRQRCSADSSVMTRAASCGTSRGRTRCSATTRARCCCIRWAATSMKA